MISTMGKNRVFFPQDALDAWLVAGSVELHGQDLVLKDEDRRYRLSEGMHVVSEITGESDSFDLVGKCKTLVFLSELGADLLERSMIIDNHAYDVIPGFLGVPMGGTEPPAAPDTTSSAQLSDEDLLAQFLSKNM